MKKLMLSLLLLHSTLGYSQEPSRSIEIHAIDSVPVMRSSGMDPASHTQLPQFIPPSPEVSSLFKFIDYPVSHSTVIIDYLKYIQIINDNEYHRSEKLVAHELGLPVFLFADYSITRGHRLLSSVTEDEVFGGHTVTTTRHYSYDSNFLLKSVTTSGSSGNNQAEETLYPTDA